MNKISKFIYYLTHRPSVLAIILINRLSPLFSDRTYIRWMYRLHIGRWPDLDNPKTFNEKLQWLKLYNRKPEYTIMADKVKAKEWVAERIGQAHIIPTLGVWDDPDDIDFDSLPDQFVLKCNHNSGTGMYICKDKSKMDVEAVKKGLRKGLKENYFLHGREWCYKNIPHQIIAEKYMVDKDCKEGDLLDYKLMCFGGKVCCSFVCSERHNKNGLKVTFYDKDWQRMPFERHYPSSLVDIPKPSKYNEMINFAEVLSKDIPFVRCDFYEIDGFVYFGEMTFYPGNGMEEFNPEEWDTYLGNLIKLPK